jgi:methyl-accepting chemotaxis protein
MSKITEALSLVIMGVGCFIGGIYYSTLEFEEQVNEWDLNYQTISDKVDVFEGVSDPETIRLYVKELNKMLDDMNRLGILIDGGNELNIILTDYEKEYVRLQKKVSEVLDEVEVVKDKLITQNITLSEDQDELFDTTEDLEIIIKDQSDYISQLNVELGQSINKVEEDVQTIKSSKYGKKIWKVKK